MSNQQWLLSPSTGRQIHVGGPAYNKLLKEGHRDADLRKLVFVSKPPRSKTHQAPSPSSQSMEQMLAMPIAGKSTSRQYDHLPPYLKRRQKTYKPESEPRDSRTRGWSVDAPQQGSQRHKLRQECGDKCFLNPESEAFPVCRKCQSDRCDCEIDCRGVSAAKVRAHQWKYTELYDTIQRLEEKCKGR